MVSFYLGGIQKVQFVQVTRSIAMNEQWASIFKPTRE